MISESTIRFVKYSPEKIPDSWVGTVPLNAEFAPTVLDIKRFTPYLMTLDNIQVPPNANVNLRAWYDDTYVEQNTAAMLADLAGDSLVGAWRLPAKNRLYLNYFGLALTANYTSHYGLWVTKPTVADKLLWNIQLSPDEQALASKLGIKDTVEKGLLPLPIRQQIEREYTIVGEETHTRSVNIAAANTVYTIETLNPRSGEFIVLTRVAAAPSIAANAVRLHIDRDDDVDYGNLLTFAMSLTTGGEVQCFIPALTELRLTATAGAVVGAHLFRYTFQRIKYNNIIRARFGLAGPDELPGDVYDKVMAGVL